MEKLWHQNINRAFFRKVNFLSGILIVPSDSTLYFGCCHHQYYSKVNCQILSARLVRGYETLCLSPYQGFLWARTHGRWSIPVAAGPLRWKDSDRSGDAIRRPPHVNSELMFRYSEILSSFLQRAIIKVTPFDIPFASSCIQTTPKRQVVWRDAEEQAWRGSFTLFWYDPFNHTVSNACIFYL